MVARRFLMSHTPKTAFTEDNVTKIHDLVLADRRLKIREIAETYMSKDRVGHILHEILSMRRLSARWVPRFLIPDNKRIRETTSEQCLTLFKRNPKEFLRRFVTVDETWIHWYTPETKAKLVELGYELLPHPPYTPDLAPCDFFLFPNLKKSLAGQKFASNEEVVAATEACFADLEKSYFSDGLKKLEHRWVKSIELKGDSYSVSRNQSMKSYR